MINFVRFFNELFFNFAKILIDFKKLLINRTNVVSEIITHLKKLAV